MQLDVEVSPPAFVMARPELGPELECTCSVPGVHIKVAFLLGKSVSTTFGPVPTTDRQTDNRPKAMHMDPPCKLHRWAKKRLKGVLCLILSLVNICNHAHAFVYKINCNVLVSSTNPWDLSQLEFEYHG